MRRVRFRRLLLWFASVWTFWLGWELVGIWGGIFAVPPFHQVMATLWAILHTKELWVAVAGTVAVAAVGYMLAAVSGVVVGISIGLSETLRAACEPIINATYSTPMTMFIPVIGIYLGLGFVGQVFLVWTFCVFLVIINTAAGVRQVPAEHLELGRSLGLGSRHLLARIVLPNAAPYILVGLRISIARAVAGAITAELLMATTDLGLYLLRAGHSFEIRRLIAGCFLVALLGVGLAAGARALERKVVGWNST